MKFEDRKQGGIPNRFVFEVVRAVQCIVVKRARGVGGRPSAVEDSLAPPRNHHKIAICRRAASNIKNGWHRRPDQRHQELGRVGRHAES